MEDARVSDRGLALSVDPGLRGTLVFAHATGFCKEVWDSVWLELRRNGCIAEFRALDFGSHGESEKRVRPHDWWDFAKDVAAVTASSAAPVIGVGHSMGAAALAMAEIRRPGTYAALVLIEPIVPPPPFERAIKHPLSTLALRRRRVFVDPEEALESYRDKAVFETWRDDVLAAYVRGGLTQTKDGWVLRCDPRDEADIYLAAQAHGAYARLSEIGCPVLLLSGAGSLSHPVEVVNQLSDRFRYVRSEVVSDTGHFLPMEQPQTIAELVKSFVGTLVG